MRLRRGALFALRLFVALALLGLVFRMAMREAPAGANALELLRSSWVRPAALPCALAAACFGASYAIGALRFHWLLRSAGLASRYAALLRAYLIASFFNLVLPGLILGDVYRLADARRDAGSGAAVAGLVALERLLGMSALGAMALAAALLLPQGLASPELRAAIAALAIAIALAPLAIASPRLTSLLERAIARVASPWPRAADALARATSAASRAAQSRGALARAFALSLANQGLPVLAVAALALPLDHDVALGWFGVVVPFTTLASLLPVSIGGTGVRELLFVAMFGALGMRAEVALALSLATLATALAWGLVGLALFAIGRRDGARAPHAPGAEPRAR